MTEPDRQAANERVATAMGWVHNESIARLTMVRWISPGGLWRHNPPDFFADPKAADELMRWLRAKPRLWGVVLDAWSAKPVVVRIVSDAVACHVIGIGEHDDWKVALALAADAAIKEAERGN